MKVRKGKSDKQKKTSKKTYKEQQKKAPGNSSDTVN